MSIEVVGETPVSSRRGTGSFPVEVFTGETKDLFVSDNLKFFLMDSGTAQSVDIGTNAESPFPIGAEMTFLRENTGTVTFLALPGVVLQSRAGLVTINAQYSAVTLKKVDTDEWRLFGDLA